MASPASSWIPGASTRNYGSKRLGMKILEMLKHGARVLQSSTSEIYGDPLVSPQVESYWGNVNTLGPRSCYDESKDLLKPYAIIIIINSV